MGQDLLVRSLQVRHQCRCNAPFQAVFLWRVEWDSPTRRPRVSKFYLTCSIFPRFLKSVFLGNSEAVNQKLCIVTFDHYRFVSPFHAPALTKCDTWTSCSKEPKQRCERRFCTWPSVAPSRHLRTWRLGTELNAFGFSWETWEGMRQWKVYTFNQFLPYFS